MVRANQRSKSRFETCDKALELVTYSCNILCNEKIFDPKYKTFIDKMASESSMIYHKVRVANSIRIDDYKKNVEEVQRRIRLEYEALNLCEDLLTDIMISQKLFHLRANRVRYWTKLTVDTKALIAAWIKSEKQRSK